MQLCRSDGPCSPPTPAAPLPALLGHGPPGRPRVGRQGRLAGRGWQLGSASRVVNSRNASPSSRTPQATPASPAAGRELARRGPSTQAPSPGCRGPLGSRARAKGLSGSSGPCGLPGVGGSRSVPGLARRGHQTPSGHLPAARPPALPSSLPTSSSSPGTPTRCDPTAGTPTHPGTRWHPLPGAGEPGTPSSEEEA